MEREALAIVMAIEKLHVYLYGNHFTLLTDCKPIKLIFSNPIARIEHWNLRHQGYGFEVVHTSGSANFSDYMSRHPCFVNVDESITMADEYVNFLVSHAVPKAMTLFDMQSNCD